LDFPPVSIADFKALTTAQGAKASILANGQSVDVGHVFTGIDAYNFPRSSGAFATIGLNSRDAATWSGDVGSALAEYVLQSRALQGDKTPPQYYRALASEDDMLGDIDGLAMETLTLPPDKDKLSDRIELYYIQTEGGHSGSEQRMKRFCRACGFAVEERGGVPRLSATARLHITDQILRFGGAWLVKTAKEMAGNGQLNAFNLQQTLMEGPERLRYSSSYFINKFIRWIEAGLDRERTHW
jgi:hypothetical protein